MGRSGFEPSFEDLPAELPIFPLPGVLLSAAGAVLLNAVLALNHRPGRYLGF